MPSRWLNDDEDYRLPENSEDEEETEENLALLRDIKTALEYMYMYLQKQKSVFTDVIEFMEGKAAYINEYLQYKEHLSKVSADLLRYYALLNNVQVHYSVRAPHAFDLRVEDFFSRNPAVPSLTQEELDTLKKINEYCVVHHEAHCSCGDLMFW